MKASVNELSSDRTYCEVKIRPTLYNSFLQNELMALQNLTEPCYVDLRQTPYGVVMPVELYERISAKVDPLYIVKVLDSVVPRTYVKERLQSTLRKPLQGTLCTIQFQTGEFLVVSTDQKQETAVLKDTRRGDLMTVPFKYINS